MPHSHGVGLVSGSQSGCEVGFRLTARVSGWLPAHSQGVGLVSGSQAGCRVVDDCLRCQHGLWFPAHSHCVVKETSVKPTPASSFQFSLICVSPSIFGVLVLLVLNLAASSHSLLRCIIINYEGKKYLGKLIAVKEYKPAGSFLTNEKFTHVFKGTSPSSRNMFHVTRRRYQSKNLTSRALF